MRRTLLAPLGLLAMLGALIAVVESYVELMTGLALDVGYPNVPPAYRTERCRDGSALDVRPETSVWP